MIELEHDFKEKPKRWGRTSPVDFVIPLQLEECLHRIKIKSDRRNIQITVKNHETNQNDDEAELTVLFPPKDVNQLEAKGKLRRWEGTSTRFEGQLTTPGWNPGVLALLIFITLLYPVLACLISFLLVGSTLDAMIAPEVFLSLMAILGLLYLLILSLLSRWSDRLTYQKFREAIEQHLRVKSKS